MSFQLIQYLLEFEKSIEVVKFDKTSVNSQRFFLDLGKTLMYNNDLESLFTLFAMVQVPA